jgi:hypothetical protein
VRMCRGAHNRLGFALHLVLLRFIHVGVTRFLTSLCYAKRRSRFYRGFLVPLRDCSKLVRSIAARRSSSEGLR